ncbi:unnamed protein product [Oppiella nova]|uniref:Uncharacterized protein n=1 Tax=Oppiella nova TaxID=334625 RepID=A0A7R9L8D4_9ACAR|nr:unnamed protein product [Oppiella nova]CAG2159281.1 unnamed protein product [Oppiella nova]
MEYSVKQKSLRSKSVGITGRTTSVRRKESFQKVRQQFEIKSASDLTNKYVVNSKGLTDGLLKANDKKIAISFTKTKSDLIRDSLDVIKESDVKISVKSATNGSYSNDQRVVPKSCGPNSGDKELVNKLSSNSAAISYGNRDIKHTNECNDKPVVSAPVVCVDFSEISGNNDSNDGYQQTLDDLYDNNSEIRLHKSLTRSTSQTSDFVTFDTEPDVVFRRPELNVNDVNNSSKSRPVPKQRTSIPKYDGEDKGFVDKELENICDKSDTNDDSVKRVGPSESPKTDTKRSSSISQDSGICDVFHNKSFLYHPNSKGVISGSGDRYKPKTTPKPKPKVEDTVNDEVFDEHIYEELSNFQSKVPNEWVDIESSDDKHNIPSEVVVNRRQHLLRPNVNYRKSLKPKPNKRKSHRRGSLPKVVVSDDHSASATEYEDIDEDDDDVCVDHNVINRQNSVQTCGQRIGSPLVKPRAISHHIYEDADEVQRQKEELKALDIKTKLVRELSTKLLDNTTDEEDLYNDNRVESEPNIYTSTPTRAPKISFDSNLNHKNNEKGLDSGSDIHLNVIPFSQIRADLMQKQDNNSNAGLIASYLEFDNTIEGHNSCHFNSEPLYQFYQKDVRRRAELWIHLDQKGPDFDYDVYEDNSIYEQRISDPNDQQLSAQRIKSYYKRNISAMDFVGNGPNRSLWCQLPQVINSKDNLLATMSPQEKRLQESMFEIITSEASYYKSIAILISHFTNCQEFNGHNEQVLTRSMALNIVHLIVRERKCLFSNIADISTASSRLLTHLERRFEKNILLYDVCDILYDFAVNHFQPYVHYCAYQRDGEKLLSQLTQTRPQFLDVLQRLESNQICQNQTLLSFLMLPMQRITRYPLLIDAVCQQLPEKSPILESARKTLTIVNQLVRQCDEETKKVQRMQELIEIEKVLHFKSKIKSYPIVSGARYLVKRGSVTRLSPQLSAKRTIGKSTLKWTKTCIHLFLFSDLLILAKKKSETNYAVFDYCSRNTVQLISLGAAGEGIGGQVGTTPVKITIPVNYQNLVQLILLNNHESKTVEYTIHFDLESDKLRWIEAVSQPSSDDPNEVIYEEWDCPQVQCVRCYSARQTDEISLEETDVLNVCRKMKDGWFEGQRIRDGVKGWFPSEFTEEIVNQHVRARNMRLRHRLLMYTQSYIEVQKRSSLDLHFMQ